MQHFRELNATNITEPTVLTIGTFDGLHRGHQALLAQLKQAAQQAQALSAVLAFHPRPKAVFAPERFGQDYLTSDVERIALFEQLNIDLLVLVPFTVALSQLTAEAFIQQLKQRLNFVQLWAGHDFALGKGRAGTIDKLAELGQTYNYTVHNFLPFLLEGQIVSSTRIRKHLMAGEIQQVTTLLGRYPSVRGTVGHGQQRGRAIGFPTANLKVPTEQLVPANGVYATYIRHIESDSRHPSVTNIGVRPSFEGQERTIETHIFDFEKDIYGQTYQLEFVARLRPEKKFETIDALIKQIQQDSQQAKALFRQNV